MQVYTLFDLNEYIRRVLALNFREGLWIAAEIGQLNQVRGHYFLDLVQKEAGDSGQIVANAQAVLWAKTYARLRANIGKDLDEVLREGLEIKVKVLVDFHERYGLRLVVEDAEPAFTFGQVELQRRATIRTLQMSGMLGKNGALPLPPVLQKIAVVTAEGAAGWQDFREHMAQNPYGYQFDFQLFQSAVQGKNVETELPTALERIARSLFDFDCVVIVRGGGARLDLAAFDSLQVCNAVAQMRIPVLTGIGHDVDQSVIDLVAHTALKTPTAVADFIVQHNLFFENQVFRTGETVRQIAQNVLRINELELVQTENMLRWASREQLRRAQWHLEQTAQSLPALAQQTLRRTAQKLDDFEAICHALDPATTLRRGFSIVKKDGKWVSSIEEIQTGDTLNIVFSNGEIASVVGELS